MEEKPKIKKSKETKKDVKVEEKLQDESVKNNVETNKVEEIKQVSKDEKKTIKKDKNVETKEKKTEAIVNGNDLHISTKASIALCNFIRGKYIEKAILDLEEVKLLKKPVPMRGEIPHKKGIMSGRYPIKAAAEFVRLLKSLKANAIANDMELEKFKIACKSNVAARPYRRFGKGRFKRTHVQIKLIALNKTY